MVARAVVVACLALGSCSGGGAAAPAATPAGAPSGEPVGDPTSEPAPDEPAPGPDEPDEVPPVEPEPPQESAAPPAPSGAKDAAQVLLDEHNRYRAQHCARPLAWSAKLAASALAWAKHLRQHGCAFEHSNTQYGENLAAGTTGAMSAADVVAMWYREVADYDFRAATFSPDSGHFTQLVWAGTAQVGCGQVSCKGMDIWVCQYDPPGNVIGDFARNVSPTSCR
jgi:uncharacterized protein YkwD